MLILFIVKTLSEYFIILVLLRNNKMLRLKELREQNGKLQREVASSLNRSKECISAWELGKTEPSIDDLKKLGDIIDKTVQEGVTNVNQVSFALSEESNVQRQLLAAAVDNARAKAAIVANAGGRNLGEMLSADISDYNGETMVAAGTNYKRSLAADVAAPTQLMPGTLKIDASVEVTFKLN